MCERALKSLLVQENVDLELIIVDDFSDSRMPEFLMNIVQENSVTYIRNEKNLGLAASRNQAIKAATGELFSFCDDDDSWPSSFARNLIDAYREKQCGVILAFKYVDRDIVNFFKKGPSLKDLFYAGVTPPVGSQVYKSSLLKQVNGYSEHVKSGVDHDLWVQLLPVNPKVSAVFGIQAIANTSLDVERMTNVEAKRRAKVLKSLTYWRSDIEKYLGPAFYQHFCHSYDMHHNYRFFRQDLSRKNFSGAARRLLNPMLITFIIRKFLCKISGQRQMGTFPPFKN